MTERLQEIEERAARVSNFTLRDGGLAEACGRALESAEDVPWLLGRIRELEEQLKDTRQFADDQLTAVQKQVEELWAQRGEVLQLHALHDTMMTVDSDGTPTVLHFDFCEECEVAWPCPTAQVVGALGTNK